ncbi:MAG: PHP domain-containing protein [Anaerolineae bacterium]|jgi:hypothetical protein
MACSSDAGGFIKLAYPAWKCRCKDTVLSPCAAVEMIPPFIVREALKNKIDLIAITDHNASANAGAVQKAAAGTGLTVLPGMELQTREEVHVLCLFDTPAHVNRKAFSLIANLGFVPPDLPIDALEISRRLSPADAREKFPQLRNFTLIQNGDVHHPDQFLGVNVFKLAAPTVAELKLALRNAQGRSPLIRPATN